MNEKERIIELVRQNVISMEEALQLLEAAAQQNATETTSKVDKDDVAQSVNQVEAPIQDSKPLIEDLQKQLTINRQRQREVEILAELDGWNDTLTEQKEALIEEAEEMIERIEELEEELEETPSTENKDERFNVNIDIDFDAYKDKFKDIMRDTFDESAELKVKSFSKQLKKVIRGFAKEVVDYSVNAGSHLVRKGTPQTLKADFTPESIHTIDVSTLTGDISCEVYEGSCIEVIAEVTSVTPRQQEMIDEMRWARIENERLVIKMNDGETNADITVRLPHKQWSLLQLNSVNGDIQLRETQAKDVQLETVNGDVDIFGVEANHLSIETVNGDMMIKESPVTVIDVETVNGNVRVIGTVGQVLINGMSSNVYLTKQDLESANVKVSVNSGNVKVAVPTDHSLEINASVMSGVIRHRLSNISRVDYLSEGSQRLTREGQTSSTMTRLELETVSGDVYLKDTE